MTTYSEFVTFFRNPLPEVHVNVAAWTEVTEMRGALRRSFNGTMLSTKRAGKRKFQATLDFPSSVEYDAFLTLISTSRDIGTSTISGLQPVIMVGRGPDSSIRNRAMTVFVDPGQATATDDSQAGGVVRPRWSLDATIWEA